MKNCNKSVKKWSKWPGKIANFYRACQSNPSHKSYQKSNPYWPSLTKKSKKHRKGWEPGKTNYSVTIPWSNSSFRLTYQPWRHTGTRNQTQKWTKSEAWLKGTRKYYLLTGKALHWIRLWGVCRRWGGRFRRIRLFWCIICHRRIWIRIFLYLIREMMRWGGVRILVRVFSRDLMWKLRKLHSVNLRSKFGRVVRLFKLLWKLEFLKLKQTS